MTNFNELQQLVSEADAPLSDVNTAVVKLISIGKVTEADMAEVLQPLRVASEAHKAIAKWASAQTAAPVQQPSQPAAPTGQGGESWSEYTEGTVDATSLSDEDTAFFVGRAASDAFFWKGIVRGTADEMKNIWDRWNHRGRFTLDNADKVRAYLASNTPLLQAYRAKTGGAGL